VSLDRRLRRELQQAGDAIVPDVERGLAAVEARARRRSSIGAPTFVAVAVVIALAVVLRFGASAQSPGGEPYPSSSPTPAVTFACPFPCYDPLAPGLHSTKDFGTPFTFTVGEGWDNRQDVRQEVDLSYLGGGTYTYPDLTVFHDGISVFRRPIAESSAREEPLAGIGTSASALAQWLQSHVDLVATGLTPVSLGGASGYRLTLTTPTGPRAAPDHCTIDHREPRCVSLFLSAEDAAPFGFGLVGPESAIVYLLDTPSGDTVMIVIDDVDGVDTAGLIAASTPVVDSIVFIVGASPSPSR
jgi:hypothetical protein